MRILTLALTAGLLTTIGSAAAGQTPWKLFQFSGTETFEYDITRDGPDGSQTGTYRMALQSAGGSPTASIEASLGDGSCSTTMPMTSPQAILPQMMMQCMMVAPVAMAMFAPTWGMFVGQNWTVGTSMQMNQGGNAFSFEITETCAHAEQEGVLARIRTEDVQIDSCVNPDLPLPLSVRMVNEANHETIEVTLTRYVP